MLTSLPTLRRAALGAALGASVVVVAAPATARAQHGASTRIGQTRTGGQGHEDASQTQANTAWSATAWTERASGTARAGVWSNPKGPGHCKPYDPWCRWGTTASTALWEIVTLTPASNGGRTVGWDFTVEGEEDDGGWWGRADAYFSHYFSTSSDGWLTPEAVLLAGGSKRFTGSFTLSDTPTVFYFYMGLTTSAHGGASADYTHTARFNWALPAGTTYTSSSGRFMTAATPPVSTVPEPSVFLLVSGGLLGVCVVARRTARRPARP